jgi:integrase
LLKTLLNFTIRKKYIFENPVNEVRPYIIDEKRREYMPEEIDLVLQAAGRIEKEVRPYAIFQKYAKRIILLLLYTGMRIGEVLNLKWENIQKDKISLKRTETKQKKEKVIP